MDENASGSTAGMGWAWRTVASILVIVCVALCGCGDDEEATGQDGEACANAGQNTCFGEVTYLCRSQDGQQYWEARENCAASATANCGCAVFSNGLVAECTVGGATGSNVVGCDGEVLHD